MTIRLAQDRTPTDHAVDLLLVLAAADVVRELDAHPGRTVVQKIFFQTKLQLASKKRLGPHHQFIRYTYGPYSAQLTKDRAQLHQHGLLGATRFVTTKRGVQIAAHYRKLLRERNGVVFAVLDDVIKARAGWSAAKAKHEAYRSQFRRGDEVLELKDIAMGTSLGLEAPDGEAFHIDKDLVEDFLLDLEFDDETAAAQRTGRRMSSGELESELSL